VARFKGLFKTDRPEGGYLLVADASTPSKPLHWHGLTVGVEPEFVRESWAKACREYRVSTVAEPIKTTIRQAVAYAFKVRGDNRGRPVPLVVKGFHPTPTHRFFRGITKAALYEDFKAAHFRDRMGLGKSDDRAFKTADPVSLVASGSSEGVGFHHETPEVSPDISPDIGVVVMGNRQGDPLCVVSATPTPQDQSPVLDPGGIPIPARSDPSRHPP